MATYRRYLKLGVLALFLTVFGLTQSNSLSHSGTPAAAAPEPPTPPAVLIDDFDNTIQERFLTTPQFGIYRIAPTRPTNPHLERFSPITDAERSAVKAFEINGWDVGMYLFGRKVTRRTDTRNPKKYDIRYRLFEPIPVTDPGKKSELRDSTELANEVKHAFVEFQKRGGANENEVRFEGGAWSYVARPVRAVNQSCLQCHKDYVITERLGDGKFTVRERRLGDANGVLVYAFRRSNKVLAEGK